MFYSNQFASAYVLKTFLSTDSFTDLSWRFKMSTFKFPPILYTLSSAVLQLIDLTFPISPRWAEWQQKSWRSPNWRPGQHRLRPRDCSVPPTWPRRVDWRHVWDAHHHWHSMWHRWRSWYCRSVPQWEQVRASMDWFRFIGCQWVGSMNCILSSA